jgi:hypothetical protein
MSWMNIFLVAFKAIQWLFCIRRAGFDFAKVDRFLPALQSQGSIHSSLISSAIVVIFMLSEGLAKSAYLLASLALRILSASSA